MTFLSYARNFEDVLLWRALANEPGGCYVDCDAADPDTNSLTRAFYDRGWSGVNLAASPAALTRFIAARPRDVSLPPADAAVGLAEMCRLHARRPVHFLKVGEPALLGSADFAACRPWIILVAATEPAGLETVMQAVGYRFVWFDGLTRFYVADERAALATAFATPPNALDGFVRAADGNGAETALTSARAEAALATAHAQGSARRLMDATRSLGATRVVAAERAETVGWLRGLLDEAQGLERRLRDENQWVHAQLAEQRRIVDERTGQLIARADEVAWLRQVLRDSEAALAAAQRDIGTIEQRARAAQTARAWLRLSPLRRLAKAVRRARGALLISTAAPPTITAQERSEPAAPPELRALPPQSPIPAPVPTPAPRSAPAPAAEPAAAPAPASRPVRVVHQFHPDAATGDAITNAMVMLRNILRGLGYTSDIFAERCDTALADIVQSVDALPRHDGYVLLAHHSMGYAGFDRIVALPARKVLVYHNITPPEFLGHTPVVQRNARLGREQLRSWRNHASAALADSDYNAIELHRLGFEAVRSSALLFEVDALRRRAAVARIPHDPGLFTILFVGRVTPSKAQDDLVTAYAQFCGQYEGPSRLVLVGAFDPDQAAYLDRLDGLMLEHGLVDRVLLTGLVPNNVLDGWYARADLYVSLSHHEGFGVPLVEAMAHGVPVLAWPAGAIAYTLGGASALLTARDPALVAEAMLGLARDPARRAAIGQGQAKALDRFALARQVPLLQEVLALAGAQPRPDAGTHASLVNHMRLAVTGPGCDAIAAAFEAARPGAVRHIGRDTHGAAVSGPEMVLSQGDAPAHRGDLLLAVATKAQASDALLYVGFDGVLTGSGHVARTLVDAGVAVPVITIADPPEPGQLAAIGAALILAGPRPPVRMAWVTSWNVRCGVAGYAEALIDAMPREGVARLAILCDDRTPGDGDGVQPCWARGGGTGTGDLVNAVRREDCDIVVIQHQPGLLPWRALAEVLAALAPRGRAVVTTLHNTAHLLGVPAPERDAAVTALAGAARVLVHTEADIDRLAALGLQATLLPHGAPAGAPSRPVRALPQAADPVIGCYGFFLPGKGIGALIRAVAGLRGRWPGIRLRLVNAEYDDPVSAVEIATCRALAEAADLAVDWHLDFLPEATSLALLAGCDLIVLPYEPSLEASSAAVRTALASGVAVAVTPIALFDDAGDAVARLPADPAALADGLTALLLDEDHRRAVSAAGERWRTERAVPIIAGRLHGMLRGLAVQRQLGIPLDGAIWSP